MDFFEASQIELSYLPKKSRYLGTNALMNVILCMNLQNLVPRIFLIMQWNIKRFSYDF
jgi:hypothetical protein